jgi:hypothetical protein
VAKLIANAAGYNDTIPHDQQTFQDVPYGSPFWMHIERLALHRLVTGYSCGGVEEPCVPPQNRPYFRWGANAVRGQVSKVVSEAKGFSDVIPPTQQTYIDVPPSNTYWLWIERLTLHGVMSGYQCGGSNEPCDPQSRPYFRWTANATRGQAAKIVSNAFLPNCITPANR